MVLQERRVDAEPDENFAGRSQTRKGRAITLPMLQRAAPAVVLVFVAALAPFPLGSIDPFFTMMWSAILALGLAAAVLAPIGAAQARLVALIIAIALGICLVEGARGLVGNSLVPSDPIWAEASAALKTQLQPSIAPTKHKALFAAGPTIAFLAALCLGILVGGLGTSVASRSLNAIAWSGVGYAIYGFYAVAFTPGMVLWMERKGYAGSMLGTFLHRNTAATYFGMMSLLWGMRLLDQIRSHIRGTISWSTMFRALERHTDKSLIINALGFFLCLLALVLTTSRAGVVLTFIASILAVVTYLRPYLPKTTRRARFILAGALGVLVLAQVAGGTIVQRFQSTESTDNVETRLAIQATALRIAVDRPWLGTGLGTFPTIFQSYRERPPSIQGIVPYGYSTPLELASEIGLPLMSVIVIATVLVLGRLGRTMFRARRRRALLVATFFIALLAIAHSSFDFPLQIPGFAIVCAAIVGIGLGLGLLKTGDSEVVSDSRRSAGAF